MKKKGLDLLADLVSVMEKVFKPWIKDYTKEQLKERAEFIVRARESIKKYKKACLKKKYYIDKSTCWDCYHTTKEKIHFKTEEELDNHIDSKERELLNAWDELQRPETKLYMNFFKPYKTKDNKPIKIKYRTERLDK